jgi:hypothetical protein
VEKVSKASLLSKEQGLVFEIAFRFCFGLLAALSYSRSIFFTESYISNIDSLNTIGVLFCVVSGTLSSDLSNLTPI